MGASKARTHGLYLGGRPFPRVCPVCRNCGEGPPLRYYNSRGLCNVCHKEIRELQGREAIEAWEPLPSEADDRNLARLHQNPARWLQRYLSGPYAQPFIDRGPAAVLQEAVRVFGSIVDRWYGRETTPSIWYPDQAPIHELVWSTDASTIEAHEPPIVTAQGKTIDDVRQDAGVRRERRGDLRRFYSWIGTKLLSFAKDVAPELPPPGTFVTGLEYSVIWVDQAAPISLVVSGEVEQTSGLISLVEDLNLEDFSFDYDRFEHVLRCMSS